MNFADSYNPTTITIPKAYVYLAPEPTEEHGIKYFQTADDNALKISYVQDPTHSASDNATVTLPTTIGFKAFAAIGGTPFEEENCPGTAYFTKTNGATTSKVNGCEGTVDESELTFNFAALGTVADGDTFTFTYQPYAPISWSKYDLATVTLYKDGAEAGVVESGSLSLPCTIDGLYDSNDYKFVVDAENPSIIELKKNRADGDVSYKLLVVSSDGSATYTWDKDASPISITSGGLELDVKTATVDVQVDSNISEYGELSHSGLNYTFTVTAEGKAQEIYPYFRVVVRKSSEPNYIIKPLIISPNTADSFTFVASTTNKTYIEGVDSSSKTLAFSVTSDESANPDILLPEGHKLYRVNSSEEYTELA